MTTTSDATSAVTPAPDLSRSPTSGLSSVVALPTGKLSDRFPNGVNWTNAVWLALMHVGGVVALWHLSGPARGQLIGFYYVSYTHLTLPTPPYV